MQCDSSVGECWCVNKMGDEEPGTRVRGNKQYCDAPGRNLFHDFALFRVRKMKYRYVTGGVFSKTWTLLREREINVKRLPNFHEFF